MNYINKKIFGIPKPLKEGYNTSSTSDRTGKEYIHKVKIYSTIYYKFHIKRQNVSRIKYFKKFKDAKLFMLMLVENNYL